MKEYRKPVISVLGLNANERFAEVCSGVLERYEVYLNDVWQNPETFDKKLPPHVELGTRFQDVVICRWHVGPDAS